MKGEHSPNLICSMPPNPQSSKCLASRMQCTGSTKSTNFSTGCHCCFEVGAGKQMLRAPSRGLLGTALLLSFFNPTRCATKTDGGMHFSLKNALTSLVASTRPTLCGIDAACAGGLATNNSEDHCGQKNAWVCLWQKNASHSDDAAKETPVAQAAVPPTDSRQPPASKNLHW